MSQVRIKAIKTKVDGIMFRSRLEATWYLYFKALGMQPVYEPDTFEILDMWDNKLGNYLPDFFLTTENCYVEIKPAMTKYGKRDIESMSKAYILGYSIDHDSIVVQGSPFTYHAFRIIYRDKGCPDGQSVRFSVSGVNKRCGVYLTCYPDENGLTDWMDPRTKFQPVNNEGQVLAATCWNRTAWRLT